MEYTAKLDHRNTPIWVSSRPPDVQMSLQPEPSPLASLILRQPMPERWTSALKPGCRPRPEMIDTTGSGAVVDECAAWPAELVVERDSCGEGQEALQDALSEAGECSGAVALEGEDVLAGPEDAL